VTGSEIPSRTHPRSPKIRPFQRRRGHAARAGTAEPLPRLSLSLLPPCDQRHMHRKDLIFESGVAPSDLLGTSRNRSVSSRTLATARSPLELWLVFFFKVSGLFLKEHLQQYPNSQLTLTVLLEKKICYSSFLIHLPFPITIGISQQFTPIPLK